MPKEVPQIALAVVHTLRSLEDDELVERAKQLAAFLETPGWEFLSGVIRRHADATLQEPVVGSAVLSQAQYADIMGNVRGLQTVLALPDAIAALAEEAESRLKQAADAADREG